MRTHASPLSRLALPFACAILAGLAAPPAEAAGRQINNNTRTSVNRNVNVNTNRNVHVDVDVDRHHHPVGTALAVGATVAVTSAVVGSVVHSVPPSCVPVQVGPVLYQQCGSTWYQPQMAGTAVQYIVVAPPPR